MGYEEEPFPAFTPYCPPLLDLPLENGAFEELPGPHATGVELPVSEWLTMPEGCLLPTQANLPIGVPSDLLAIMTNSSCLLCKHVLNFVSRYILMSITVRLAIAGL